MMAYSPNLVIGAWVGHTGPGNQYMNGVFGTMVGSSVLRDFINNGLSQANFKVDAFQQPSGLVTGPPCQNNANVNPSASASPSASSSAKVGAEKELYLPGTECTAAATPSPSASASASTAPSIVATPSLPVCATPAPTPTQTPGATPASTPSSGPTPSPTPTPTCIPPLPGG
jgi:membrane peptidoglycan carboxypeptidase